MPTSYSLQTLTTYLNQTCTDATKSALAIYTVNLFRQAITTPGIVTKVLSATCGSVIIETESTGFTSLADAEAGVTEIDNIVFDTALYGPVTTQTTIVPVYTPISGICFPAGTPIKTDQGFINIEHINPMVNTLGQQAIRQITKTVTLDKYLICFEKDALSRNVPDRKTIMTKDHKIEYNGQMVVAEKFLQFSNKVKKVQYSGEVLYNVLLATYGKMSVNNLVCETLHPENIIAKLYTSNFSKTYTQNVISIMNESLLKGDLHAYKTIVNRL